MLLLGSSFASLPILSLRIGRPIGSVVGHVINPHKLTVDALWVKVENSREPKLLLHQDIREISPQGIIVNDLYAITDQEDAIRLKSTIDLKFELLGKKVISGRWPLGKVADYALDADGLVIQKLYVEPNVFGRLKTSRLTIGRSQVVEVSPKYIRVKGTETRQGSSKIRQTRQSSRLSAVPSSSAAATDE